MSVPRLRPRGLAPLYWNVPAAWRSAPAAQEAIDLCALPDRNGAPGWSFDPWQRSNLELVQGEDERGEWAGQVYIIIVSRQQGKTDRILVPSALHQLVVMEPNESVYSAHHGKTMRGAFIEMKNRLESVPSLHAKVKKITDSWGKEFIEMKNGATMDFMARTRGGGRGFSVGGLIVLDEALFLGEEASDAIVPTIIAKSGPRILLASTAGLADSVVLRDLRDRGREGDPDLGYVEYGLPHGMTCRLGDDCDHARGRAGCLAEPSAEALRASCPGVECGRIPVKNMRTVRSMLTAKGFFREVFTVWDEPASAARVTYAQWQAHAYQDTPEGRAEAEIGTDAERVYAFDVAPEGVFASLHVAARREDGGGHLERLDSDFGTDWLVAALVRLPTDAVIIADARGPGYALENELAALGVKVTWINTVEMAAAATALQVQLKKPTATSGIRHAGDEGMKDGFSDAYARNIGDGMWLWARMKSTPGVVKLIATSMALWGLTQAEDLSGYDPLDYLA